MMMMQSKITSFGFFLGGILSYGILDWIHQRYKKTLILSKNLTPTSTIKKKDRAIVCQAQDELLEEQLSRVKTFFGQDGYNKIREAFVVVVGLGGVGSHAAHMLARSGIKKLRLIDFDNVTLSSLNRHAVATRHDVGIPKVEAMKNHLLDIIPDCEIDAVPFMFEDASVDELLCGEPTFVLDCIDDVSTKVALLAACVEKNLQVITATGAGAKADPTRIHIGNLLDTTSKFCVGMCCGIMNDLEISWIEDALAIKVKYFLKKRGIDLVNFPIPTVFSSQKPSCSLLPLEKDQIDDPNAFGNVENFRIRVIPVLGTMPAQFGQAMAAFVLTAVAGVPITPEVCARLTKDQRNKLFQKLQQREFKMHQVEMKNLPLLKDDIDFVVQEIWQGKSPIGGARYGGRDRMLLTRWNKEKDATFNNVVLLSGKEVDLLDSKGIHAFDPQVVQSVNQRLANYI